MKAIISTSLLSLMLLVSVPSSQAQESLYPDVEADAWFAPYVQQVTEEGLMEGYPDGRFGAWDPINRAEFAKVILELKSQLKKPWWEEHLFELLLVVITMAGWLTLISMMSKVTANISRKSTPRPQPSQETVKDQGTRESQHDQSSKNAQSNWWND